MDPATALRAHTESASSRRVGLGRAALDAGAFRTGHGNEVLMSNTQRQLQSVPYRSVELLRNASRRRFCASAVKFASNEQFALLDALDGAVSTDVRNQLVRLLRPLGAAASPSEAVRHDLDDAARVIASLARVHCRDIVIARACAEALRGIGQLVELGDIAAGRVDPPDLRAA